MNVLLDNVVSTVLSAQGEFQVWVFWRANHIDFLIRTWLSLNKYVDALPWNKYLHTK